MKKIMVVAILGMALLLSLVGCTQRSVESIAITKTPKTIYRLNEEFDRAGGEITATIKDGKDTESEVVPMTDDRVTVEGFDSSSLANSQTVTISFEGKTTTLVVSIAEVSKIEIGTAIKKDYNLNDAFDKNTGSLKVTLTNDAIQTIPLTDEGVTITGFDSTTTGINKQITINYGGKSITQLVTIKDATIKSIRVTQNPDKMDYWTTNEPNTLEPEGGIITVTKTDNTTTEVDLDDPRVKLTYDFRTRGINDINRKVTVEFGGYQTNFDVNLDSERLRIEVVTAPKQNYIKYEPFYMGSGSIRLVYQDGNNDEILLSSGRVVVEDYDREAADGAQTVKLKLTTVSSTVFENPTEVTFETTISVNLKETAASPIMQSYVLLKDEIVDWRNGTSTLEEDSTGLTSAQKLEKAGDMLATYSTLGTEDIKSLDLYKERIISLAMASEIMDIYRDALTINGFKLEESTYEEALAMVTPLTDFVADLEAHESASSAFAAYDDWSLQSGVTVLSIRNAITDAGSYSQIQQTRISGVTAIYTPFQAALTSGKRWAGQELLTTAGVPEAIQAAYAALMTDEVRDAQGNVTAGLSQAEAIIYANILCSWRTDFMEILYEYYYHVNNRSFVDVAEDGITGSVEALMGRNIQPKYITDLVYLYIMYQAVAYPSMSSDDPISIAFYTYYYEYRDITHRIYNDGYESIIALYEEYPYLVNRTVAMSAVYYDMLYYDQSIMYSKTGAYYNPDSDVEAFLRIYLPAMDRLLGYDTSYKPESLQYENDVKAVRDAFYRLTTDQRRQVLVYFNDGYFYALTGGYFEIILSSAEMDVWELFMRFEYSYALFLTDISNNEVFYAMADYYSLFNKAYNLLPDRNHFTSVLDYEFQFMLDMDTWLRYMSGQYGDIAVNEALSDVIEDLRFANEALNDTTVSKEKFAAYLLRAVASINELAESTDEEDVAAIEFFKESSVSSNVDGKSWADYYEGLLESLIRYFPTVIDRAEVQTTIATFFPTNATLNPATTILADLTSRFDATTAQAILDLSEDYLDMAIESLRSYYKPGYAAYDTAVAALRADYLELISKEDPKVGIYVLTNVQQMSTSYMLQDLFIPLLNEELSSDNEKTAMASLYTIAYSYHYYEAGRITLEELLEIITQYNTKYTAITNKTDFNELLSDDIAFIQEIIDFATDLSAGTIGSTTDATLAEVIKYVSYARSAYAAYGNLPLQTAYITKANELLATISVDTTQIKPYLNSPEKSLATLIEEMTNVHDAILLRDSSQDADTKALYADLITAIKWFYTNTGTIERNVYEKDTDGSLTSTVKETVKQVNWAANSDWVNLVRGMINKYMAMSDLQRGAFYPLQAGDDNTGRSYDYLRYFMSEYLAYTLDSANYIDPNTASSDAVNTANTFFIMVGYLGAYHYGMGPVSTFISAYDAYFGYYTKLNVTQEAAFETAVGASNIGHFRSVKDLYAYGGSDSLKYAIDLMIRVIEGYKFAQNTGDYTYFAFYYRQVVDIRASITSADRGYLNERSYNGATFSTLVGNTGNGTYDLLYKQLYADTITSDALAVFYRQYLFVARKFISNGGGFDLILFDTNYYVGNADTDVKMLIDAFEALTLDEQGKILASSVTVSSASVDVSYSQVLGTMLRFYYAGQLQSIDQVEIFNTFYNAMVAYHQGDTAAFESLMAEVDAAETSPEFDEILASQLALYQDELSQA